MHEYTKDEALAFIDSLGGTISGKVGFKWLGERLAALASYVGSVADENERLNAYLDSANLRDGYESYLATHPEALRGDASGDA